MAVCFNPKFTNVYNLHANHVEMKIYRDNVYLASSLIDLADLETVKHYRWSITNHGYLTSRSWNAENETYSKPFYIHRLIMNPTKGLVVDHINHDTLDNRRSNLRSVTRSLNSFNKRGGNVRQIRNRYYVYFKINGRQEAFGGYPTEAEAKERALELRIKLSGLG